VSSTGELSWGRRLINGSASGFLLGAIGESCETTLSYCVFGSQISYNIAGWPNFWLDLRRDQTIVQGKAYQLSNVMQPQFLHHV
jgi:hypothetical protein